MSAGRARRGVSQVTRGGENTGTSTDQRDEAMSDLRKGKKIIF